MIIYFIFTLFLLLAFCLFLQKLFNFTIAGQTSPFIHMCPVYNVSGAEVSPVINDL